MPTSGEEISKLKPIFISPLFSKQVCDRTCGTGRYGDWHCNWQSLGGKCRFCFLDIVKARLADKLAREAGGRVIMCETHEPPPDENHMSRADGIGTLTQNDVIMGTLEPTHRDGMYVKELISTNPGLKPFFGDIVRGNICIFIPGYFDLFHETRVTMSSISTFMPGVTMVIATHPMDYHVFNR